jgi:hypothetical protein
MAAAVAVTVVFATVAAAVVPGVVGNPDLLLVAMAGPALLRPGVRTASHHQQQHRK